MAWTEQRRDREDPGVGLGSCFCQATPTSLNLLMNRRWTGPDCSTVHETLHWVSWDERTFFLHYETAEQRRRKFCKKCQAVVFHRNTRGQPRFFIQSSTLLHWCKFSCVEHFFAKRFLGLICMCKISDEAKMSCATHKLLLLHPPVVAQGL